MSVAEHLAKSQVMADAKAAAGRALQLVDWSDLSLLRSLRTPPASVGDTLGVVNVLLGRDMAWDAAKLTLGDRALLEKLSAFDLDAVSDEALEAVGTMLDRPTLQDDAVRRSSAPCAALCAWARAVHRYGITRRELALSE